MGTNLRIIGKYTADVDNMCDFAMFFDSLNVVVGEILDIGPQSKERETTIFDNYVGIMTALSTPERASTIVFSL